MKESHPFKSILLTLLSTALFCNLQAQGELFPTTAPAPSMHSLEQIWQILETHHSQLQEQQQQIEKSAADLKSTEMKVNNLSANNYLLMEHVGVQHTWHSKTIDSRDDIGEFTSLAFSPQGFPAISYYDNTNHTLKFVSANDALGSSWKEPVMVATEISLAYPTSLAFSPQGIPAISYHDTSNKNLKFACANDLSGSSWEIVIVDDHEDVGKHTISLKFSPKGIPAISYYDEPNDKLKFAYANDAQGNSWNTCVVIDTNERRMGQHNSLAFSPEGYPSISCKEMRFGDLIFVRAIDPQGSKWRNPVVANRLYNSGDSPSLSYSPGGFATISFVNKEINNLQFIRANDKDGESWSFPIVVDDLEASIRYTSLDYSPLGLPAIAYLVESDPGWSFKFVQSKDKQGLSWSTPVIVDSQPYTGITGSLAFSSDGLPAISYYEMFAGDLRFAIRLPSLNP